LTNQIAEYRVEDNANAEIKRELELIEIDIDDKG